MQLKLGKMTGKEIAQWFGIKYSTYQSFTKKYLEKLDDFCSFDKIYGGIIVKEIYRYEYERGFSMKLDQIYLQEVLAHDGLSSVSGISEKYELSRHQVVKSRNRLFGEHAKEIVENAHGILGTREYVWAVKISNAPNDYRFMSYDEEDKFNQLIESVYGQLSAEDIKLQQKIIAECAEQGDSAQQLKEKLESRKLNFFDKVICRFKKDTGLQLVHINYHEILLMILKNSDVDEEYKNILLKEFNKNDWRDL